MLTRRGMIGRRMGAARLAAAVAAASALAAPFAASLPAQQGAVPGVALGLAYDVERLPPIAVLPFAGPADAGALAAEVGAIVARDLDYSDRFAVIDSLPAELARDGVRYALWDQYGADWVLTGEIEEAAGRRFLNLELHDVVFARVAQRGAFALPPLADADFRMAVHRASDQVVTWVTGDPGAAASRIVFAMRPFGDPSAKELYVVDSDGEDLRRLTWDADLAISPAWAPDGERIAYVSYKSGLPRIYELHLADGSERALELDRPEQQFTPAYHPDGGELALNLMDAGLFAYNLRDRCCLRRLTGGRAQNIQPTYSHDGEHVAFVSSRLGTATPQVFRIPVRGGQPELVSPYRYGRGGYFTDPDWSPRGGKVAFAGGIVNQRVMGQYHIFVADADRGGNRLVQLTREGSSEDPSWAPDGRHIVFIGERRNGHGVWVVDSATGRSRIVVAGVEASDTDWSPPLAARGAGSGSP